MDIETIRSQVALLVENQSNMLDALKVMKPKCSESHLLDNSHESNVQDADSEDSDTKSESDESSEQVQHSHADDDEDYASSHHGCLQAEQVAWGKEQPDAIVCSRTFHRKAQHSLYEPNRSKELTAHQGISKPDSSNLRPFPIYRCHGLLYI